MRAFTERDAALVELSDRLFALVRDRAAVLRMVQSDVSSSRRMRIWPVLGQIFVFPSKLAKFLPLFRGNHSGYTR